MNVKLNDIEGVSWVGVMLRATLRDNTRVRRVGFGEIEVRTRAKPRDPCPMGANGRLCTGNGVCGRGGMCRCDPGFYGRACGARMEALPDRGQCPFYQDKICAGNGYCAENFICDCYNDDEHGHWTGTNCAQCRDGWYGPYCKQSCGPSILNPCNNHGICVDGVSGSGDCLCEDGWRGADDCSIRDNRNDCLSVCQFGSCDLFGICTCLEGWGGPSCGIQCPRGAGEICSGHGRCSSLDGECRCDEGWSGADCRTPIDFVLCGSINGLQCGGRGTCRSGTCRCDENFRGLRCEECSDGWSGPNCQFRLNANACPTFGSVRCNAKGACIEGNCICIGHHDGSSCQRCEENWTGADCQTPIALQCPVANDGGGMCGGSRGTCIGNTCFCHQNFDGAACDQCKDGWAGVNCNTPQGAFCPVSNGVECGGRGPCLGSNCVCGGNYDGPACERCAQGWTGFNCGTRAQLQCGIGLNGEICSANGVCTLDGCACLGNFAGDDCSQCEQGWTGPNCNIGVGCPVSVDGGCGGDLRGECIDNRCVCKAPYTGPGCTACQAGRTGTFCEITLIGGCGRIDGALCSGRGNCLNSERCVCQGNYAGVACHTCAAGWSGSNCLDRILICPAVNGLECGGPVRGTCTTNGVCRCFGNRAGAACGSCLAGWGGADCTTVVSQRCPTGLNGLECSGINRGTCNFFNNQCTCNGNFAGLGCDSCAAGWTGTDCNTLIGRCPFSFGDECGGLTRGQCNSNTGLCECFGNRAGVACSDCQDGWSGPECLSSTCPIGNNGNVCSGSGECVLNRFNGVFSCSCDEVVIPLGFERCGNACDLCPITGNQCGQGSGRWGDFCLECPAFSSVNGVISVCTGNGVCNDGPLGNGGCTCFEGWTGFECNTPQFGLTNNDADDEDAAAGDTTVTE
eukprot:TRINITY_DN66617_c4_g12_i1.p1 TRINITY_DN66617_c4_g12~~TRINITY_DN66617_c4_g12_i1.p1  ORF type:complete len:1037 (+),score=92.60 TRINITY_DN66617_c4_g12_i1:386-3112(+)